MPDAKKTTTKKTTTTKKAAPAVDQEARKAIRGLCAAVCGDYKLPEALRAAAAECARLIAVLLLVALTGCTAVGEYVSDVTGATPRARYAAWGDYYSGQVQPAEDQAAITRAQAILRGTE